MQKTFEVEDKKGSRSDLAGALAKMEEDLKSAFYEAEDIMDLVAYHRAEEQALGHTSSWVQRRVVVAAGACSIARCFRRSWFWLGQWIGVTRPVLQLCAIRLYKLGRFVICKIHSATDVARAMLLENFRISGATTSGSLLPVSAARSIPGSGGSMVCRPGSQATVDAAGELRGPRPSLLQPAKNVGEEIEDAKDEEKEEEKATVKEEEEQGTAVKEEIEEQSDEEEEQGTAVKEEIEEQSDEEEEQRTAVKEEIEEQSDEEEMDGKVKEAIGDFYRCIRQCFQYILIWSSDAIAFARITIAFARSYQDWSFDAIGIKSNQRGGLAVYSFFPPFGTNSLSKRIEHIENILDDSKKSNPLNQQSSSNDIPLKDSKKERSSSEIPVKDTKKESSSREGQIDDLHRKIERKVFGRDKEVKCICEMFRKRPDARGSKPYSVLGVHGIAGSGKTTLACYICDHEKKAQDKHFDVVMFSHVSVNFRVDNIFRDMLREIRKGWESDSNNIESLRNELMEKLRGKRFLLVLDDLWFNYKNQKEEDILLHALCTGQNGSVILVTAQRRDAAAALGAQEQILIPDLEEEKYLELFMHHALQGADDDNGKFGRIGRIIAEKLHRSPITALAVARRLQTEKSISYWETITNLDVLNETMGALWWSYLQLGADTRRCFQYCSTYPKGYNLDRFELVQSWIAHGFLNTSNGIEELEDVGQSCLDELVKFSFLQLDMRRVKTGAFTIHDLLHELAERVAGSDFLRIDDLNGLPAEDKDIPPGVRHLFIETKNGAQVAQVVERNLDLGNLRTLIIKEPYSVMNRSHDLENIFERLFMRLRKLRVLILESGVCDSIRELPLPASMGQMKHLRYLGFSHHDGEWTTLILPSTFSKLYQMQTIYFGLCHSVSCPDGVANNLICMRHIRGRLDFPNVGRMTSLQTMGGWFHVKKGQGYELKQLKDLIKLRGSLEIIGLEDVGSKEEAREAQLGSKKQITKLKLRFTAWYRTTKGRDRDAEVLDGLCPPKDLQELTIKGYNGSAYPSWMLSGRHPEAPKHLHKLTFDICRCPLASIPEDSNNLFTGLRELYIKCEDWDSLPANMERLVSLQTLELLECHKMEILPVLPRSLKCICIIDCRKLSRTCREEGHVNWQKIQAIPRKRII